MKKTATKTTKTVETVKPLVVSLVGVETPNDVISRVACAKVSAGRAITMDELATIIDNEYAHFIDNLFGVYNALVRTSEGFIEKLTAERVEHKKIGYWKNLWNAIRGKR
jgi:hypothetical protein